MDASDNVLRGGLTPKRIDLDELQRIMRFDSEEVSKVLMVKDGYGRRVYNTPTEAFSLISAVSGDYHITDSKLMLALVTEGVVRFSSEGESITLEKGECAILPKSLSDYSMKVRGQIFFAAVPEGK
jgi:mannose-6-phosphate isomerase